MTLRPILEAAYANPPSMPDWLSPRCVPAGESQAIERRLSGGQLLFARPAAQLPIVSWGLLLGGTLGLAATATQVRGIQGFEPKNPASKPGKDKSASTAGE